MNKKNLIEIGYCAKPHGIKGEFTFVIYEEFQEDLENDSKIVIVGSTAKSKIHNKEEIVKIEKINFGHKIMARLEGISNRNEVEEMIPFSIYLGRDTIDDLHEGEILLQDYVGMEVFEFQTEKKLGPVIKYYDNGAQIILVIGKGQNTFEIPLIDNFVKEINVEKREIRVIAPIYIS